jgi:hypothetical protein
MIKFSNDGGHTRNSEVLASFIGYCVAHPQDRFWQALLNWSGFGYIFASGVSLHEIRPPAPGTVKDTYNFEGRNL